MKFILFSLLCLFSCFSHAGSCVRNVSSLTATIASKIDVQRDAAVGQPISGWFVSPQSSIYTCSGGGYNIKEYTTMVSSGTYSESGKTYTLYKTNMDGVGVAIRARSKATGSLSDYYDFPYSVLWCGSDCAPGGGYTRSFTAVYEASVRFIKTNYIQSGILDSTNVGGVQTVVGYNGAVTNTMPIVYTSAVVNVLACSITANNLSFPIGDVLASKFGTSVGTIPSGAQNTQNLGLNCDAGANINVMLQGTQNPDVGTTSVLALTGQGNGDVARGVGVQLLYNGTPLVLNQRIVLKTSAGGQETFPIVARYYQTKNSVTTGKANASATLDLTYQ